MSPATNDIFGLFSLSSEALRLHTRQPQPAWLVVQFFRGHTWFNLAASQSSRWSNVEKSATNEEKQYFTFRRGGWKRCRWRSLGDIERFWHRWLTSNGSKEKSMIIMPSGSPETMDAVNVGNNKESYGTSTAPACHKHRKSLGVYTPGVIYCW